MDNNKKFLNYSGLETLVGIIKGNYAEKNDLLAVQEVATNAAEAATTLSSTKQDKLVAGANIQIAADGKTISATDTKYNNATTSTAGLMSAEDKSKLDTIDVTGQENVIEVVKVNGTALTPDASKAVDVTVPTKTSQLTNDSTFVGSNDLTTLENNLRNSLIATSEKGANNGVAELDAAGKVPTSQLPSYVDDVVEAENFAALPATGEAGKIYVTLDDNKTFRWSGSAYVEISASLALGSTSSTAFRGDYGQTAYTHATDAGKISEAVASGMYKVAGTADGHIASLTAMTGADIEGLLSFASAADIDTLFTTPAA